MAMKYAVLLVCLFVGAAAQTCESQLFSQENNNHPLFCELFLERICTENACKVSDRNFKVLRLDAARTATEASTTETAATAAIHV